VCTGKVWHGHHQWAELRPHVVVYITTHSVNQTSDSQPLDATCTSRVQLTRHVTTLYSGVTSNSGALDKYPKSSLSLSYLPLPLHPSPSHASLPLSVPPYPFTSFQSSPSSYTRGVGERYIAPQRVRVEPGCQTHFCAIHCPKSANLLKVSPTRTRRPYTL